MNERWTVLAICLSLTAMVWAIYGQTLRYGFVNYDDGVYVYQNDVVQAGLTVQNLLQVFTHVHLLNWQPLTLLSLMLDHHFYGLNASGYHLTNLLLHTANVLLLFWILRQMTGRIWPSAFLAALYAIHPLRVESVAWVTERKDVLSGFFFMLTLAAYVRYVRNPWSVGRYLPVLVFFACGLMSKSMLVTLPFVLLLLDYWPLDRFGARDKKYFSVPRRLIIEKIPLGLLSIAMGLVTLQAQTGAMPVTPIPLSFRVSNALVACVTYLGRLFYPTNLAVFYPLPEAGYPLWQSGLSLFLLVAITVVVWRWRQNRPYLLVGWLWFLVMLLPVTGFIQVGGQARADRYTYLPEIGLCLSFTWAMAEVSEAWRHRIKLLVAGAASVIIALVLVAHAQAAYWHDSGRLWQHTLDSTTANAVAEKNLASYLLAQGRTVEAITHTKAAIAIDPNYEEAQNCLGDALVSEGKLDEAIAHYQEAVKIKPGYFDALNNLGQTFLQTGRLDEAIDSFQRALNFQPAKMADEAAVESNLGAALILKGQTESAVVQLLKAVALTPDSVSPACNLAWALATSPNAAIRDGERALQLSKHADQLTGGNNPKVLNILAAAEAETGNFSSAVTTAATALQLAREQGNAPLVEILSKEITLYEAGQPFRDSGQRP
jgi:tetratricopeptide (TPR) repeat protein